MFLLKLLYRYIVVIATINCYNFDIVILRRTYEGCKKKW